jgi:hypothetical protein
MTRNCIHCGRPLPEVPWWKRVLALGMTGPPFHNPNGPDGQACWDGLARRLGLKNPGPKP